MFRTTARFGSKLLALAGLALFASGLQAQVAPEAPAQQEWPHELTVYSIPSPWGMDWSSPRALAVAGMKNKVSFKHVGHKHAIGHVFIQLKDPTLDGEVLTGMTTVSQEEEIALAVKHGYGLGALTASMHGKFDSSEKLRVDMEARFKSGLISFMRFKLSPENGARLATFFKQYQARGADQHYGGADRPRYAEGGGCSAFGVSFIDVAGLLEPEYHEHWKVLLRIPRRLFGGPWTGLEVPLRRIFFYGRWANEDEPHAKLTMWDPSLIHDWITQKWEDERESPTGKWTPELRGRARGLLVDARERPAPQEPIFLSDAPGTPHPYARQGGTHFQHQELETSQTEIRTLTIQNAEGEALAEAEGAETSGQ